jgi:glycosyltransferase involved in cell wall biosynthesis
VLPSLDGIEVVPVATHASPTDLVPALREAGLVPMSLDARSSVDLRWATTLRRLVRRVRPDLVHVHAPLPAVGARLALRGMGRPLVYTEHNLWEAYRLPTRIANALTMPADAATIAVSDAVRASMRRSALGRRLSGRVDVVRNGIDIRRVVTHAAEPLREPLGGVTFGTVANLRYPKGVDVLIRAAALVQRERPEAVCVVVGRGAERAGLVELAARCGADVRLLGLRPDARAIIRNLDVFALPSRIEGLPVALLEAMALCRPIVATAVGGTPEVIDDGETGVLVPAEDPDALATSILALLGDADARKRLGEAAAAAAARNWDASVTASHLREIYERVIGA